MLTTSSTSRHVGPPAKTIIGARRRLRLNTPIGTGFHLTNSTPQHEGFNRSGEKGLLGRTRKLHHQDAKKGTDRLVLFAGPVFSESDRNYHGVLVPKQFWKVVVAPAETDTTTDEKKTNGHNGKKAAVAVLVWGPASGLRFLLSQEKLVDDMEQFI